MLRLFLMTADDEGISFFRLLFEVIKEELFSIELREYQHITFDAQAATSFRLLFFGFFVGVNIAALISIFYKRVLGDFVRALISNECFSAESAKTLSELGYQKNPAVRSSLRHGVTLRRVVRCVEEDEYLSALERKRAEYEATGNDNKRKKPKFRETEYKIKPDTAHFYIPEQLKYMADIKFEKKGTNWLTFFAVLVLSLVSVILVFKFLPDVLQYIDNFLSMFSAPEVY
ncbi:MAG: hypothetical protein GX057_06425 [Clostridiales bacterium]|nr:hypothetical protein [Clostridiales bacterium]